jgi:hypothetical protein
MPYDSLYRLLGFGTEGEVEEEVIALEVRAGGWKIRCFSRDKSGPGSGVTEPKVAFQ